MRHHVRAQYLVELVRFMRDVASEELLADDFGQEDLTDPARSIDGAAFFRVLERAARLSGDPSSFGWRFGMELGTTKHGFLGYLARSSATLRDVFVHDTQFLPTRVSALSLSMHATGDDTRVEIRTAISLGSAWPIVVNLIAATLARLGEEILPEGVFADAFGAFVVDVQPLSVSITVPTALLDVPLRSPDAHLAGLSVEQLQRSVAERPEQTSAARSVAAVLKESLDDTTTLESVAKRLAMSPRTLRRKLASDGTSFQKVLDEVREARARDYLRATDLTVDEIAAHLAFRSASSFCQAFKRWTGTSPGQFREGAATDRKPHE